MVVHANRIDDLVARIVALKEKQKRVVVAIAGIPGAGKSTLVDQLVKALAVKKLDAQPFPQDGFHYTRAELAKFDDPAEAFRRRGAPFTFNATEFVNKVKSLRLGSVVKVPLFDHSKKDPVEDDIEIRQEIPVVLVEGNYVGLEDEPWRQIADFADELWYINAPTDLVRERIIKRHMESGIADNIADAVARADGLDWQNALYVMEHTQDPTVIVEIK